MAIVVLLVGLGATIVEGVLIYFARRHGRRAGLIEHAPPAKAGNMGPGLAKLTGQVVAIAGTVDGPLTNTPCVYYRFKVEEKVTQYHGHGASSHWKTIVNDVQSRACAVQDESGIVGVNLREAELLLEPDAQAKSGFLNDAPPALERTLARYGKTSKGWIFNKTMRYTETRIDEGDSLFIVGDAQQTPGGNWEFVKGDDLFLVSDRGESELVAQYRGYALWCWVGATLVLVGLLAAAVLLSLR
jgi:hypothetical protein